MKILLVADLHYTLRQWDWLVESAHRFDLVVVAGDLLDMGSIVPPEVQVVVVRKTLERIAGKVPVLVSSGNHDVFQSRDGGEKDAVWLREERVPQVWVDGDAVEIGGLFFSILPWWEGEKTKKAVESQLAADARRVGGRRWVWVYHAPPRGALVAWTGRRDFGDECLVGWMEEFRPEMVLGGHIHNAPFVKDGSWVDKVGETWVFNGGRQPGGVPTFTVIDTEEYLATWVAAGDAEKASLRGELAREPLG